MSTLGVIRMITIHQLEGRADDCQPRVFQGSTALECADQWLQLISERAPADGSYYKTDVLICFADGTTTSSRHYVKRGDTDGTVLGHLIRWVKAALADPGLHRLSAEEEAGMRRVLANAQAAIGKEVMG